MTGVLVGMGTVGRDRREPISTVSLNKLTRDAKLRSVHPEIVAQVIHGGTQGHTCLSRPCDLDIH